MSEFLETMSGVTGLSKDELARIAADVKENHRKLRACQDHSFTEDTTPDKPLNKTWRCTRCGGTVSAITKSWYELGRQHQRQYEKVYGGRT